MVRSIRATLRGLCLTFLRACFAIVVVYSCCFQEHYIQQFRAYQTQSNLQEVVHCATRGVGPGISGDTRSPRPSSLARETAFQCACRLAALYLDAFPPSCHRLGMPLTATAAARATAAATASSRAAQTPPRSPTPRSDDPHEVEPTAASNAAGHSGRPSDVATTAVAVGVAPSSNADAEMLDVVDADGDTTAAASSEKGDGAGGGSSSGTGGDGTSNAMPPVAGEVAVAMEVDGARQETGVQDAGIPSAAIDLSGEPHAMAAQTPAETPGMIPGSADAGNQPGGTEVGKAVTVTAASAAATADVASGLRCTEAPTPTAALPNPAQPEDGHSTGSGSSNPGGSDQLGKRRRSPVIHGLPSIDTDGDNLLVENDARGVRESERVHRPGGASQIQQGEKEIAAFDLLGLRGIPGPDLSPFFRGSALDAKAVRKDGSSGGGSSNSSGGAGPRRGTRLAAIVEGLRRMGASEARSTAEAAAAVAMAARISDGNATQEVRRHGLKSRG